MHVAFLPPTRHLYYALNSPYHLTIPSPLETIPEYRSFYASRAKAGEFVIVDNGAFEGENHNPEQLFELASRIHASEVASPEVANDAPATLQVLRDVLKEGISRDIRIMGIPQGGNPDEFWWCVDEMVGMGVHTLGIPYMTTRRLFPDSSRSAIVSQIVERVDLTKTAIHCLGLSSLREMKDLVKLPVRGTDSSIFFTLAFAGRFDLDDKPARPPNYFISVIPPANTPIADQAVNYALEVLHRE